MSRFNPSTEYGVLRTFHDVYAADYGVDSTGIIDSTGAINAAVAAAPAHSRIIFPQGTYLIGAVAKIGNGVTLDFRGSSIKANTTGTVFTFGMPSELPARGPKIINFHWINNPSVTPTDIIQIVDGLPNVEVDGYFDTVTASHAYINSVNSYGLKVRGQMISCNVPNCIYLTYSAGNQTLVADIDVDITRNSGGTGITLEGLDDGTIRGVIENTQGGIFWNGSGELIKLDIKSYFESNSNYDIKLQDGAGIARAITVNSQFIGSTTNNKIMLGNNVWVMAHDCFYQHGGVCAISTANISAAQYVGINNQQSQTTTGYTNFSEIADNISTLLKKVIINGSGLNAGEIKPSSLNAEVVNLQVSANGLLSDPWFKNYNPASNTEGWTATNVTPTVATSANYFGQEVTLNSTGAPAALILTLNAAYLAGKRITMKAIGERTVGTSDAWAMVISLDGGTTYNGLNIPSYVSNTVAYWTESTFTEKTGYYDIPSNQTGTIKIGFRCTSSGITSVFSGVQIWIGDVRFNIS